MQLQTTFTLLIIISLVLCCGEPIDHTQNQATNIVSELLLPESALAEYEKNIDHKKLISTQDKDTYRKGQQIYANVCFSCHGNIDEVGSIPNSVKFWKDKLIHGNDPYAMYETLTRGYGLMPPQVQLVPQEKYAVINFIREKFIKEHNPSQYFEINDTYLESLPIGSIEGPTAKNYKPWADMDYGPFLINTYEVADSNAAPREISGGRSPLPNEKSYVQMNFAYKGHAIRLDEGEGGVAKGKAWALFDQDLMRIAGVWTGSEFIDWQAILMNERHNISPRTYGDVHYQNPVTPGWANPDNGSWDDPRFQAVDGRRFGPLPKAWTHYKGLYRHENKVILSYTVGDANVLDHFSIEDEVIFTRTLNVSASSQPIQMRIAPASARVAYYGDNVSVIEKNGFHQLNIPNDKEVRVKIMISRDSGKSLLELANKSVKPEDLSKYTKGGPSQYPETLETTPIQGNGNDAYAVDVLTLPSHNKWNARMRPSGIDFIHGTNDAYICTIDGDVWRVIDLTSEQGPIKWKRLATGMFQPLGIKYHKGELYVGCRNEIVKLIDLNGDQEIDFYKSFNNDHQVTDHFHEFAMGLQVDDNDNFYYAKSGRHARTALIPQHGTLIKISPEGKESEIIANGFRAANGVCINPDGSFFVTDQEGYWNPMNRINRVKQGGFYGNMYGYGAPKDSSDQAMEQPICWIDMRMDRSPSELVWADSKKWGELNNQLLNLSYGYGKIYAVYQEEVNGQIQGGMTPLPIPQTPTGLVRARFHPEDGQMYACGMTAWATSQVLQAGGLYRIRKTKAKLNLATSLNTLSNGIKLNFPNNFDEATALDTTNYKIKTWQLKRTSSYGSKRYNEKELNITSIKKDGNSLILQIPELSPTWVIEIKYQLKDLAGKPFQGLIHGSIYNLPDELSI